jgi:Fic family protein
MGPRRVVYFELEREALSLSSFSSTSIEGNPLPLTEVRKILKNRPQSARNSELEVLQYNDALVWLNELVKEKNFLLTDKLIIKAHQKIMKDLLPKVKLGKFRREPVLVNDPKLRRPIFWPPDFKDVERWVGELIDFVDSEKKGLDPLILAGIYHKQFVLIHPFIDGNGRTVRLTTKTLLAELGLDTFPLFSFESYYNRNVSKYFEMVGERGDFCDLRDQLDFTPWLEYFCEGVVDELQRVEKVLVENAPATPLEELNSDQVKILTYLQKRDFVRDREYAKLTDRAKATRALDFKKLVDLGYLEREGAGPSTFYRLKR